MRSVEMIMRLAAAVFIAAGTAAAQTPSFAGRWVLAPEPPSRTQSGGRLTPSAPGTLWGSDVTLTQDATTLTVEYARFARSDMQPPTKLVYRLDGAESRNTINVGRGPQEQVSRAKWDGERLTIVTQHRFTTSAAGVTPGQRQSAPTGNTPSARPQTAQDPKDPENMTSETTQVIWLESPASLVIETTAGGVMGGPSSTARSVFKKG